MEESTYEVTFKDGSKPELVYGPADMSEKDIQIKALDQHEQRKILTDIDNEQYLSQRTPLQTKLEEIPDIPSVTDLPLPGIVKNFLPDTSIKNPGGEIYGALETIKTLATGIPTGLMSMFAEEVLTSKYEGEGMTNIQARGQAQKESGKFQSKFTDTPESREGQRNLEGIGDFFEEAKLPPIMPGMPVRPGGIKKVKLPKKERRTQIQQKAYSQKLYDEANEAGAVIKQSVFKKFGDNLKASFVANGYRGNILDQNTAKGIIDEIVSLSKSTKGVSLEQLQTLRTMAGNAAKNADATVSGLGLEAMHLLDDFTAGAKQSSLLKGDKLSFAKWKLARQAYSTQAKMREIEVLMEKSKLKGKMKGEELQKFRQEILAMVTNPKRLKMYSQREIRALEKFAGGGPLNKLFKGLGTLAPKSGAGFGLSVAGPITAAAQFGMPAEAVVPWLAGQYGIGLSARYLDDALIRRQKGKIDSEINLGKDYKFKPGIKVDPLSSSIGVGLLDDISDERNGTNEKIRGLIDSIGRKKVTSAQIPR